GPQFTVEQARAQMDAAGVSRVIFVPPSWNGWDNDYALSYAEAEPDRYAVMGRFNVAAPDARERLASWRKQPGMLGIRIFFMGEPWMTLLTDPGYAWFWSGCEQSRMPMMATIPGNI